MKEIHYICSVTLSTQDQHLFLVGSLLMGSSSVTVQSLRSVISTEALQGTIHVKLSRMIILLNL